MKRIFVENLSKTSQNLHFKNLNYLKKTLRFKGGEEILVFDGEKQAKAIFNNNSIIIKEPYTYKEKTFLDLAVAEIKKERLEWLVEKSTEIGVKEIFLIKTERTQTFYNLERLQNIAISASKQSNRISIPKISSYYFDKFIKKIDHKNWNFASLNSNNVKITSQINGTIIGPEGGWSKNEEKILNEHFESVFLNTNILRTETAAITALNYIMYSNFLYRTNTE